LILKLTLLKNTNTKNKIQNTKERFGCAWTHPVRMPLTNELQIVSLCLWNTFSWIIIFHLQ